MKRLIVFSALALFIAVGCKETKEDRKVKTVEINFTKNGELKLLKQNTDSIIQTLDIEIADDEYKTQTGMMYRSAMEDSQGMLFIFPDSQVRSFYMKNTQIGLDILFINSDKRIVSFQKDARPYDTTPLPSGVPAQYVLEIKAGLSNKWNLEIGDRVEWTVTE
jgi:uncharacterized protein